MNALAKVNIKKTGTLIFLIGLIVAALLIFNNYFYKNHAALANEQQSLTATGTIEATTAMASFKVPGKLANILVAEGSQVASGQEIASLEDHEIASQVLTAQGAYEAAIGQADQANQAVPLTSQQVEGTIAQTQAKVAQAEIGVKDAKLTFDRVTELFKSGAVPQKSLDDATNGYDLAQKKLEEAKAGLDQALSARANVQVAESKYQAAQGQVKQADGSVQTAQAYLNNTHLMAPMSGFITQQYLQNGELLNAGTPVFEITDLEHTFVNIYISEDKIGRVKLDQEAEIKVDAFPDQVFKGKVVLINGAGEFAVKKAINDQYDHDIRSFKVKIDVPNSDLFLKTGMTARVKIIEGEE
ncbi:HlyD family secretion protein [Desulfitobacterium sp.]|uniref:HlyD family secretion protein n=1 Tax=Desulfitobacterium sp. TaxID=49981 RepID=UPI002B1FE83D|nr:efflux RND transporter periplasmic adaptor subunit [Desulfitobacterium sp.]MEA4900377.1 efflux RND transporter periplasmic adaptor subunit [Desulfitobacterium sp.]